MIARNTLTGSLPDMSRVPTIDQVGIEERVERLKSAASRRNRRCMR